METNQYGELMDGDEILNEEERARALSEIESILQNAPIVDFHKDLGLKKPTFYERVHTKIGMTTAKYMPTFTRAYESLKRKIHN